MKRSLLTRMVTALWGIWFIAALTGPATLHACPQHAGVAHSGHSGAHAAMHGAKSQHHQSQQGGLDHKCNCLSECCAAVALAPSTVKVPQSPVSSVTESPACSGGCDAASARSDHAQPFPNGPPSRV